jgi:hypothetical protein
MDKDIIDLLDAENLHIKKLQEIVRKTIEDEDLIIQNLLWIIGGQWLSQGLFENK